jgi:UDP-N-acetyl-2-amino-2-deoxyglucuronate dehydrogenase
MTGVLPSYFGLIGVGGYVAPRHLRAIKDVGGLLTAAFDPRDSVGLMDSYFPDARFFTEFERFDRHIDRMRREGSGVNYIAICSPNYLHDSHVRFALRSGAHAICEKPLVLNPRNIDMLAELERETGRKVNTILQLRLHPAVNALRDKIRSLNKSNKLDVELTYITSRGRWYYVSWKGDEAKSGGIAINIGIHFYDMLGYIFGDVSVNEVHHRAMDCAAGYIEFERARVRWFLSINPRDLPGEDPKRFGTFRSISVGDDQLEFSEGFTDLHTESYRRIVEDRGFGLDEVRPCVEIGARIRTAEIRHNPDRAHALVSRALGDAERYQDGWPV